MSLQNCGKYLDGVAPMTSFRIPRSLSTPSPAQARDFAAVPVCIQPVSNTPGPGTHHLRLGNRLSSSVGKTAESKNVPTATFSPGSIVNLLRRKVVVRSPTSLCTRLSSIVNPDGQHELYGSKLCPMQLQGTEMLVVLGVKLHDPPNKQ